MIHVMKIGHAVPFDVVDRRVILYEYGAVPRGEPHLPCTRTLVKLFSAELLRHSVSID